MTSVSKTENKLGYYVFETLAWTKLGYTVFKRIDILWNPTILLVFKIC